MTNLELKIADKIKAKIQDNQYIDWPFVSSHVKADNLYKVWGLMIAEGILSQGYRNIKNNPRYKLA